MRKTEQFQLSQWDLGDRILMDDFNADNRKLESALAALSAAGGGASVFDDWVYSEEKHYMRLEYDLTRYVPDWSQWALVGMLVESDSADYAAATDSYHFSLLSTAGEEFAAVQFPKPGTALLLLTPFFSSEASAGGLLLAGDFVRPVWMQKPFSQLKGAIFDYRAAKGHTLHVTRETAFGIR